MNIPDGLTQIGPAARFFLLACDVPATEAAWAWADAGLTVRVVRGSKMRTEEGVFDEFGAALQFPSYFGENWPAWRECLGDLEWLAAGQGYVLVVTDADKVLPPRLSSPLDVLVRLLVDASSEWAQPVALGESWDRPAAPFHVVLQASAAQGNAAAARWSAAGAEVVPLEV